jgi:hypothetical protein
VELVKVKGTVTLDGKPLPGAYLEFKPIVTGSESIRPSYGLTDEDGKYKLEYSTTKSGARPGKYNVSIWTKRGAEPRPDGSMAPPVPEQVPDVYNTASTLTAEITSDNRVFNFDLQSSAGTVVDRPGDVQ